MSTAAGPGITITFASDLSAVYAQYAQFLQYVRSNPAVVSGAAGLNGGGGRNGSAYGGGNVTNVTNNYVTPGGVQATGGVAGGGGGQAARQITAQERADIHREADRFYREAQQGLGRGGGARPDQDGNGRGVLERTLYRVAGVVAAYAANRAIAHVADYRMSSITATTPEARAAAEMGAAFNIPVIGTAMKLAYGEEFAWNQAKAQQTQQNIQFQRSYNEYNRGNAFSLMGMQAGNGQLNTPEYRKSQIERERLDAIDAAKATQSEADARVTESKEMAKNKLLERTRWDRSAGITTKYDAGLTEIEANQTKGVGANRAIRDRADYAANSRAAAQQKAEDFSNKQLLQSQQLAEHASYLSLIFQPHVAEALQTAQGGMMEADRLKFQGQGEAAKYKLGATRNQLLEMQRDLLLGGTAQSYENLAGVDLSGTNTDANQKDDTPAALARLTELLASIDQKLAN